MDPFDELFGNQQIRPMPGMMVIDIFPVTFHAQPLLRLDKIKAFALLWWPVESKNWLQVARQVKPEDTFLFLTAAFDLEEAKKKCDAGFRLSGKDKNKFFLAKSVAMDYDQLFPELAAQITDLMKKTETPPAPPPEPPVQEPAAPEAENRTPFERFIYNIKLVLDKSNPTEEERVVVEELIKKFKKNYE